MARKPTKAQIREQARQEFEQRQREKQYAIIKFEDANGWGFVYEVSQAMILHYTPNIDLTRYSCQAIAFDRDNVQWWADHIAAKKGVKTTVINVEERYDDLRYSYNLVVMAQRYV